MYCVSNVIFVFKVILIFFLKNTTVKNVGK